MKEISFQFNKNYYDLFTKNDNNIIINFINGVFNTTYSYGSYDNINFKIKNTNDTITVQNIGYIVFKIDNNRNVEGFVTLSMLHLSSILCRKIVYIRNNYSRVRFNMYTSGVEHVYDPDQRKSKI